MPEGRQERDFPLLRQQAAKEGITIAELIRRSLKKPQESKNVERDKK